MFILSLFIFLYYIKNQSKTKLYSIIKSESINYTDNLEFLKGFDLRYGIEKHNDTLFTEIKNNFMKKKLLEKLKNPSISTFEKIKIIDDFDILHNSMKVDFYKGGLIDDWDFTI